MVIAYLKSPFCVINLNNKESNYMKSSLSSRAIVLALAFLATAPQISYAAASPSPVAAEPSDKTVVAKITIDGKVIEITLGQVKDKVQLLPPQLQKAPFKDIFPLILESVVTEQIVLTEAKKAGLESDPKYQKMVGECRNGVLQKLFLDKQIDKRATNEELKKAYEEVKKSAPKEDEYNISMITVADKKKADSIIKDLKKSGVSKFAEIADAESLNKIPGGNLGYIRLGELPEAFREKIKNASKATLVPSPVEMSLPDPKDEKKKITTYNVIFVQDKRAAAFPPYEAVKDELKGAIGSKFAKEAIKEFREKTQVELFNMDGSKIEEKKDAEPKAAPAA
jgi:peptidyl-prolyl cis-trans isomerase C